METDKNNLIEVINKLKDEIEKIKAELTIEKDTIERCENVRLKLTVLAKQLKGIEDILKPKRDKFKERLHELDSLISEINGVKGDVILEGIEDMINNINNNLLDGMKMSKKDDRYQVILFEGKEVGCIEVLEDDRPKIKIRVVIHDKKDIFEINDTKRIYSIISFINTSFNYK